MHRVSDALSPRPSPLERAVARVGDRWTLLVVDALLDGPRKFGELAELVPSIAPNILTKRLRQLEHDGLVVARAYSQRPVRMAYELTIAGRDLAAALALLTSWGARSEGLDDPLHHRSCGSAVDLVRWCPTCERIVTDDEADDTTWA